MSGATIDDSINAAKLESETLPEMEALPAVEPQRGLGLDLSLLKAKTGEGRIEDYIEHPMNFMQSRGLAQALRGATGMMGALDLAIIDIVMGVLNFTKERKANAHTV